MTDTKTETWKIALTLALEELRYYILKAGYAVEGEDCIDYWLKQAVKQMNQREENNK